MSNRIKVVVQRMKEEMSGKMLKRKRFWRRMMGKLVIVMTSKTSKSNNIKTLTTTITSVDFT